MIKNDKQAAITRTRIKEFQDALIQLETEKDIDPILKKIQIDGVKSQIEEFQSDLTEYEQLKGGNVSFILANNLSDYLTALIKVRIARGWTQLQLAEKVGVAEQQIQRYESCSYSTATISKLSEISEALEMDIEPFKVELHKSYNFSETINQDHLLKINQRIKERKVLMEIK